MLRQVEFACAALLLCAVVVLVGLAAITRAMGIPIIWSVEIAQLIFLWLCILAADLALQDERHFGLQIVKDNVPQKIGRLVEIANLLVIVALLAFLIPYAWRNMLLMHTRLDGALQIPGSWLHASMVVGFALMVRTLLSKLLTIFARKAA